MWRDKELQNPGMVGHSGLYEYEVTFYSVKKGKEYRVISAMNKDDAMREARHMLRTMRGFTILSVDGKW